MSKDRDTLLLQHYKKSLIKFHISVDICKECEFFNLTNKLSCTREVPNDEECNLLKVHFIK